MPQITNLEAATELEAVNLMLSAIGEAPVASVDVDDLHVNMAINLLYDTAREVQTEGWKFNQEFGLAIEPYGTMTWTDPDGEEVDLNIFKVPDNLSRWNVSKTVEQQGLDLAARPPKEFPIEPADAFVFYDRTANRDGLESEDFDLLYLDVVWYLDFEQMPDTARRYITIVAARKFIRDLTGDENRFRFTAADEVKALRYLKRDQGDEDEYNMLNSPDVASFFGNRPPIAGSFVDLRSDP